MPPHRRLCSLASGIVIIFFCLSFLAHQLDPRTALFVPHHRPFPPNPPTLLSLHPSPPKPPTTQQQLSLHPSPPNPQPLLTLINMTRKFQASSPKVQAQSFQDNHQTPSYYAQAPQNYQHGHNFQTRDPRQSPNFQGQGVQQFRQTLDSYAQGAEDSQQASNSNPHRVLNSYPQRLANSQHAPYYHPLQGFFTQNNSHTRGPTILANSQVSTNSQPQQLPYQADSNSASNSQPQTPANSPYTSRSRPQEPLNSAYSYHTSNVQPQGLLNPLISHQRSNSHTQAHQPLNSQPQALQAQDPHLQALQDVSVQAHARHETQQNQSLHQTNFQTGLHPHPHNMTPTPTSTINPGLNQSTNTPQSTLSQPSNRPQPTPNQPTISPQSTRGVGQCKKKYWRCDSPPTDPEPPLEDIQELEDLPGHPFTAPHWTHYADRGYTVLDRNQSSSKRLPDVLIIGAKKSGTRALLAFLRVHPSIRASGPEVHYFDRFYAKGLDWYRSKLPLSLAWQLTVEKTPAYFTSAGVPARVKQDLPAAKLLLVVRDPVTRALSDYTQSLSKHKWRRAFDELAFVRASPGLVNSEWGPISGGLYARHLQRWLHYFPRAAIHVVSGENLIRDPAAELCKVQEFLGLRRVITEKHFFFNVTKGFPCLVKREKTGRPHCLGSSKGRSHPPVSQATLNTLRDFYRPFNFKFYKMVGQNFRW